MAKPMLENRTGHTLLGFALAILRAEHPAGKIDAIARAEHVAGKIDAIARAEHLEGKIDAILRAEHPASEEIDSNDNKVLTVRGCDVEVGSPCFIVDRGSDAAIEVEQTGMVLVPIGRISNLEKILTETYVSRTGDIGNGMEGKNRALSCSPESNSHARCLTNEPGECTTTVMGEERVASGNVCVDSSSAVKSAAKKSKAGSKKGGGLSGGGTRGGSGSGGAVKICNILQQLHALEQKNDTVVEGRVVRRFRGMDGSLRYMVLLDVYLSTEVWDVSRNYWRTGPLIADGFSHLSCDWRLRNDVMMGMVTNDGSNVEDISVWEVGECSVHGCKLHHRLSEEAKGMRFDLNALFKSLPSIDRDDKPLGTNIEADEGANPMQLGIWSMPDEVLTIILGKLVPRDLHSVAAVCRHTRTLGVSVMPCMSLKLFPHQQSAVLWMLQRELSPQTLPNPFIREMQTEDGSMMYLDCVTGALSPEKPPLVCDFRGGLFCDEPGLGKTVTALSLILKTQGTIAQPPAGVSVRWCEHSSDLKKGYYDINPIDVPHGIAGMSPLKRSSALKARRFLLDSTQDRSIVDTSLSGRKRSRESNRANSHDSSSSSGQSVLNRSSRSSSARIASAVAADLLRNASQVKRKLSASFAGVEESGSAAKILKDLRYSSNGHWNSKGQRTAERASTRLCNNSFPLIDRSASLYGNCVAPIDVDGGKHGVLDLSNAIVDDVWAQCDACSKWRKLPEDSPKLEEGLPWFCSMNKDRFHQDCGADEVTFGDETITSLPGFIQYGRSSEDVLNVSFFRNVLKSHGQFVDAEAKQALAWLADMPAEKLGKVGVGGFNLPQALRLASVSGENSHQYDKLFEAFGLMKRKEGKKKFKWCYPRGLSNLVFDSKALKVALSDPVEDVTRFYLSKATLVVVPQNLIEHWRTQINRHTTPGQLKVHIWSEKKPPAAHSLAWDYDIVITTFSRLSTEWSCRESSPLGQIHWLRIVLDEGHTLGASLTLTNKLQMAISMQASRRWLLTGTPTPNTPSSQVAHLQPMLKFLHEEFYGKQQRMWETAVLRPFEAGREEGRERLLNLLHRCMISARKCDLRTIPKCIRKVKLLDFSAQHAASYNELVTTVKRNILLADWNDPTHVESLLNPKQWKSRSTTIRNVRLSCCVAGHIKVRNAGEDIRETMDMFEEQGMNISSEEFVTIKSSLLLGGPCQRCNEWCRLPIVTPCRHLLCLSCVSLDSQKCTFPGCANAYMMQNPEDRARPENPSPKWPVPQDLIELQPSYVQDDWDPDWQSTSSSKVAYLVGQLKELHGRNEKILHLSTMERLGDEVPMMIGREIHVESQEVLLETKKILPEKAIVFSQFLEHINVVEKQLTAAGLRFVSMYSPMHSSNKMKSLMTFQKDPECTVLVMDGSAALGLDLSFVTQVYLMEPIWDRSMEEQVVSRAHRMGATRPVLVETLAMNGTIEEQMLEFLKNPSEFGRRDGHLQDVAECNKSQRSMHDPAERGYLAHLEFVRNI